MQKKFQMASVGFYYRSWSQQQFLIMLLLPLKKKTQHHVMMSDISLLYIFFYFHYPLYQPPPIISPSFHRNQFQVYCQVQSVCEQVHWRILQIRPQGSHCITFSYFLSRESSTQYNFSGVVIWFSWSLFSVLCYIILSLSFSYWHYEVQLSAVFPFEVSLFLVVDAESGYPVGDREEKEHRFFYISCSFFMYPMSK